MKIVKRERTKVPANKELWKEVQRMLKGKIDIEIPEYVDDSITVKMGRGRT